LTCQLAHGSSELLVILYMGLFDLSIPIVAMDGFVAITTMQVDVIGIKVFLYTKIQVCNRPVNTAIAVVVEAIEAPGLAIMGVLAKEVAQAKHHDTDIQV
jgi:hypothetical protein